jgi:hypothetical protein
VQPELTPLLIAYVTQGHQLPASLPGAVSPPDFLRKSRAELMA